MSGKLYFKSPFSNVKRLIFQWCTLPKYICNIQIYFPKVQILKFNGYNKLNDSVLFIESLPELKRLKSLIFGKEVNIPFFILFQQAIKGINIRYEKRR